MEANTAMAVAPKTFVKVESFMGDQDVAGTSLALYTISKENNEANIPAVTI